MTQTDMENSLAEQQAESIANEAEVILDQLDDIRIGIEEVTRVKLIRGKTLQEWDRGTG